MQNLSVMNLDLKALTRKFDLMLPLLDERQRRIYLASEAEAIGHGGVSVVSRLSGCARSTLDGALDPTELTALPAGRVRRPGGGRKGAVDADPELLVAVKKLVDPDTRGDPDSPLQWVSKSTRQLARALKVKGFKVSHKLVGRILKQLGYSLQSPVKTREGKQHPDRDAQFQHISAQVTEHQVAGEPVISVDTKKKELIGDFRNAGREYQPKGKPEETGVHDFPDPALGKVSPFGVYDVQRNEALVNVGRDHDTSAFAVESIRRWWFSMGAEVYPDATRLLVTADGGGSNGYRRRLWKSELAKFAAETNLEISVCHLPPGTSKWNKIEHRLFSHITMNWRGKPLRTHEAVVNLIGCTTTKTGLSVRAVHDVNQYPKGVQVTDEEMEEIPIVPHDFHGEWNYTIHPGWVELE